MAAGGKAVSTGLDTGDIAYCIVDVSDDAPRPGTSISAWAQIVDLAGNGIAKAGVKITWGLEGGENAAINPSTSATDSGGRATTSVSFTASLGKDEVYVVTASAEA